MPAWALHVDADLDEVNLHWGALEAAGMLAAAEVDGAAIIYFAQRPDDPPLDGRLEHIADRDWHERWREGLTPVRAGRWTVTPPWLATGGTDELRIAPGQAFGTGHHETTVGCLEALDALSLTGCTVLDVGAGTGVLAIAAARAGAEVTAVDIDPLATAAASDNARRNRVSVAVVTGTLDRVAGRTFDVVVANLDSGTLVAAAGGLARVVAPGGILVAGGVSNARSDEVAGTLTSAGLSVEVSTGREWSLLRARPSTG